MTKAAKKRTEKRYILVQNEIAYLEHFEFTRDGIRGVFGRDINKAAMVSSKEAVQHISKCCLGINKKVVEVTIEVPEA